MDRPLAEEEFSSSQKQTNDRLTPRTPRKVRERTRHRNEVLAATERLFMSHHYQDVGVKDIAGEAEFSVGYLYKLFPNKEEIILSLFRRKMAERFQLIQTSLTLDLPFSDRFENLIESLEGWQRRNSAFHPSIVGAVFDLISDSPEIRADHTKHDAAIREMLHSFFSEAIDTGCLFAEDPSMITDSFEAVLKGFVIKNMRSCMHVSSGAAEWKGFGSTLRKLILRAFDPSWKTGRGGSDVRS